jgi:antitoxin PrlF
MAARFVTSRLGTRSQTVVPKAVREALRIGPGDEIGYAIKDGRVVLVPVRPEGGRQEDPFACFDEWSSDNDERAYGSL